MNDLRFALRLLRSSRLFTITVVLTIALGIGATTAIFSVVNAVLLRPLPFGEPTRLMQVAEKNDRLNLPNFGASVLNYLSWKEQTLDWRTVGPGYFETLRIPLLGGRDFTAADTATAPAVMIVSRATARTFWGEDDPIGRTVRRVADGKDFTVVGVVGDVRSTTLNRESPALYYSAGYRTWALMDIVARVEGDTASVVTAIRRKVREMDPDVPIANVRPMAQWVSSSAAQPRLNATLLGVFAAIALVVSAIGTYGVVAYSVSQRTKELAVRMALGADRAGVLRLVVGEGMLVASAGIAAGVAGAMALSRALSSMVFGVSVRDPSTFVAVPLMLAGVALAASAVPAIRASRVNPITALRLD